MKYYDIHTHNIKKIPGTIKIVNLDLNDLKILKTGDFCSAGIHPWNASGMQEDLLTKLEGLLKEDVLLAVGEIGLDKCCKTPFELQKNIFERQLLLANEYKKAVIIHCVKAWQDILEIKKKYPSNNTWIIHNFNSSFEQAKSFISRGCYLSFGHKLLSNEKKFLETFANVPVDKIFLETDTSEVNFIELYKKAADIKGMDLIFFTTKIEDNFKLVFGLTS